MPGTVPFQTQTRGARRRAEAGQTPYPAVASSSSSSRLPTSSPAAATSRALIDSTIDVPSTSSSSRLRNSPLAVAPSPQASSGSTVSASIASSSLSSSPVSISGVIPSPQASNDSIIDASEQGDPSSTTGSALPSIIVNQNEAMRASAHPDQTEHRPRMPGEGIYLPVIPSSPLQQVYPEPLRPTTPTLPSLCLDSSPSGSSELENEVDITDNVFSNKPPLPVGGIIFIDDDADPMTYSADINRHFPNIQAGSRDADILFPELEASRWNFHNPAIWSLSSRPRNPNHLCSSRVCPINLEPHYEGRFLFRGQPNRNPNASFGASNPPPAIWRAFTRILEGHAVQEDRIRVWGFAYCHRS